ncbi:MAG: ribonuclease D [Streptosporangiales bacterium]|nr:ribonuclease D [Streptosporangiales bacterium]
MSHDGAGPIPLLEPREGVPPVVETPQAFAEAIRRLAAATGPVAVDAERASGYRYGHRAYLVQLRRRGAGTMIIDPVACPDLSELDDALMDTEAVLHAANQDLPCLAELGFRPRRIFDTELAGRLLGYQRVGLATMVETVLGVRLEKAHSAVDWSRRPLPANWLRYAALDVELLIELRDALEEQLHATGKLAWSHEEFAAIAAAPPSAQRRDPWRRTSGIHRIRSRRALAGVRELWLARDRLARQRDLSPGRVLPDAAIIEAALAMPRSPGDLVRLPGFTGGAARNHVRLWFRALTRASKLPERALPELTLQSEGPPPANRWGDRDPVAAERLAAARAVVAAIADEHEIPTENLVQPDAIRRLVWSPSSELSSEAVASELRNHGARPWQVRLVAIPLAKALRRLEIRSKSSGPPTRN